MTEKPRSPTRKPRTSPSAKCVRDHHFDAVFDAYIADGEVRAFLGEHNPEALKEMSERLIEAQDRGLWRPRLNSAHEMLTALAGGESSGAAKANR